MRNYVEHKRLWTERVREPHSWFGLGGENPQEKTLRWVALEKGKIDDSGIIPRLESVRYDMLCNLMTRARAAWRGKGNLVQWRARGSPAWDEGSYKVESIFSRKHILCSKWTRPTSWTLALLSSKCKDRTQSMTEGLLVVRSSIFVIEMRSWFWFRARDFAGSSLSNERGWREIAEKKCFRYTGKSQRHVKDNLNNVPLSIVWSADKDSTMPWSTSNGRLLDVLVEGQRNWRVSSNPNCLRRHNSHGSAEPLRYYKYVQVRVVNGIVQWY